MVRMCVCVYAFTKKHFLMENRQINYANEFPINYEIINLEENINSIKEALLWQVSDVVVVGFRKNLHEFFILSTNKKSEKMNEIRGVVYVN